MRLVHLALGPTWLHACHAQPGLLPCVFELAEINKQPRMEHSEDVTKVCRGEATFTDGGALAPG
ncbi:hypothetical protein ACP70R_025796 [Stipagrostis hirtigluma subsp. patula]